MSARKRRAAARTPATAHNRPQGSDFGPAVGVRLAAVPRITEAALERITLGADLTASYGDHVRCHLGLSAEPLDATALLAAVRESHLRLLSADADRRGFHAQETSPQAINRGPSHQYRTKRLEVVNAIDPDRPTGAMIRRARIRDPLRRLVLRDGWAYRLYLAADEFRTDCQNASGGRSIADALDKARLGLPIVSGSAPWDRSNEAMPGQMDAQARLRQAWAMIGIIAGGVFSWVVISNGSLADYDECKRLRKGDGGKTLKAALGRLANLYEIGDVQPPPDWNYRP